MAFNIVLYAYAIIGHTWADQLLPQLLVEQFDTFPIQSRHIERFHVVRPCVRPSVRNALFP